MHLPRRGDVAENPSLHSDHCKDLAMHLSQCTHRSAEICDAEGCSAKAENAHQVRHFSLQEAHTTVSAAAVTFADIDHALPSPSLEDCHGAKSSEHKGSSISVWSRAWAVFQSRTACSSNCGLRGNMRVQWNAALRRASAMDPVRHLQERVFGCHWPPSASTSIKSIWLLGVGYPLSTLEEHDEVYKQFEADFHSCLWITYRKGFQAIMGTKLTTDVGWGCMIRSGQMLLAQALICHHLGRGWQRSDSTLRDYLEILHCFGDIPSCPYSIHNIVKNGGPFGLVAGCWLGPYAMCRSLEALMGSYRKPCLVGNQKAASPMAIHVVSGEPEGERGGAPCICIDVVSEICSGWGGAPGEACSLLLLIPLVLGLNKVNSRYLPLLSETFSFPQSLGVLGGKPGASTYMVGVQGDQIIYLDPHQVQQVCLVSPDNPQADTSTYHCSNVKRMALSTIDPSLALGFYCRNQEDFLDLCRRAIELEKKGDGVPLFTISQSNKAEPLIRDTHFSTCSDEGWQMI